MAVVAAPYGLLPVSNLGGRPMNHGIRQLPLTASYGTSIFYGDVVKLALNTTPVTIEKDTGTATATPVGIFLGVTFTDPTYGKVFRQNWVAGTTISDANAIAYVCDDPSAIFRVAYVSSGTTISTVARTSAIGKNAALVQNSGSTANGRSAVAVSGLATTNTLPLRVIDVVPESQNSSGNFSELLVKWNFGMHQYDRALGL